MKSPIWVEGRWCSCWIAKIDRSDSVLWRSGWIGSGIGGGTVGSCHGTIEEKLWVFGPREGIGWGGDSISSTSTLRLGVALDVVGWSQKLLLYWHTTTGCIFLFAGIGTLPPCSDSRNGWMIEMDAISHVWSTSSPTLISSCQGLNNKIHDRGWATAFTCHVRSRR